jgi:hypothetical protein
MSIRAAISKQLLPHPRCSPLRLVSLRVAVCVGVQPKALTNMGGVLAYNPSCTLAFGVGSLPER